MAEAGGGVFAGVFHRLFPGTRLVDPRWLLQLKLQNAFSKKIRVGFGYIITSERTLGNRKWHIDPIVRYINRTSGTYVCNLFFPTEDLARFDIAVILKHIKFTRPEEIARLKKAGTKLVFNVSDNPASCEFDYEEALWFTGEMDRLLILNPLMSKNLPQYESRFRTIDPPIIDPRHKTDYSQRGPVRIFWDGYLNNMYTLERLNAVVEKLARDVDQDIEMVYNTNLPARDDGIIKYREWSIRNWKEMILRSDIGVIIKPVDDERQQKKPPTKLISYMSSGLPVVCTPSAADRSVVAHGETGYFAYTDDELYRYLRDLVESRDLRERIGVAARRSVAERFSIDRVARRYTEIFDELIQERRGSRS
jgi:hypothetical protein